MSPQETHDGVDVKDNTTRKRGSEAAGASAGDATPRSGGQSDEAELCPVVEAVEEIGSRWRLAVLYELQGAEIRFNELKRRTDANARTLSRVLDDLQERGLVDRRLEEDSPVATYYSLTEKGEMLCPVFDELADWGSEWVLDRPETVTEG